MNSLLTLHRGPDRIDLGLRFGEAIQQGMRRKLFQSCQPGNAETARDEKVPERACRPGRCETLTPSVAYRNAGELRIANAELRMEDVLPSPMNLTAGELQKQQPFGTKRPICT